MKNSPADIKSFFAEVEEESVESGQSEIAMPDYGFYKITCPSTGVIIITSTLASV